VNIFDAASLVLPYETYLPKSFSDVLRKHAAVSEGSPR
jgi:hypothetical protein